MKELTTDQFFWEDRTGTAEASDLGFRVGELPEQFALTSTKTGDRLVFWRTVQTVHEGDLLYTLFASTVNGKFVFINIFND